MGKTLIQVECLDQKLTALSAPTIASGGRNEDVVEFSFCPLWDGFVKTAVFYREKKNAYHVLIDDNKCIIPHEVLANEGMVYFGVFGVKGEIVRTTEVLRYRVKAGVLTDSTKPSDPTPDVYTQIMGKVDQLSEEIVNTPQTVTNVLSGLVDPIIKKEAVEFIRKEVVEDGNYFDKNSPDMVSGYFNPLGSNAGTITASGNIYAIHVPVSTGTYRMLTAVEHYGTYNAKNICLFDAEKTYITTQEGSIDAETNVVTLQIDNPNVAYIGYTVRTKDLDTAMIVKDMEYPEEYIPYVGTQYYFTGVQYRASDLPRLTTNVLYGKIAVFDGDSIGNGSSAYDGLSGWAGRIGDANNMVWSNYAVGGGTITAETYSGETAHHWISRNIDIIYAAKPNLDYLVFEGGTNDADIFNGQDDKFGTFTDTDFSGTYDDTTFSGAMETMLYKAVTLFPTAKIGYIVAPKMGRYAVGYGDSNPRYKFFERAMEICKKWGVPYLNLWDESFLNPMLDAHYDQNMTGAENRTNGHLYTDGQHLTALGYDAITPRIEAWMRSL